MKGKIIVGIAVISMIANIILGFIILKEREEVKPDTPFELASLFMEATGNKDNYKSLKELLVEPYKEAITEEELQQITVLHTRGAELFSYSVVSFKNEAGEEQVILLKLTPELGDGKIKIQNIKIVPEEMEDFLLN